jgi:gamma-glutamyltranspeptidase / glutathione hydrolase
VGGWTHAPPAVSTIYVVPVTPYGLAAGHPLAAAEGVRILERGGSAAEAAIAVAFVQGVVDPAKCGIGGWGVATYFEAATGMLTSIDAPGRAGSGARADMWVDDVLEPAYHGYLPRLRGAVNDVGYRAIATPGAVALYAELYRLRGQGRIDWADLVAPAIGLARNGVRIESGVLGAGEPEWDWPGAVSFAQRLAATPASARGYLPGGRLFRVGEVLRQPDLAATLETLASDGDEAFYRGAIAERIANDFRTHGADITVGDLAAYRSMVGPALERPYRTCRVGVPWPPESGVSLLALLARLEGRLDTSAALLDASNLEPLVEALEFVARQRAGILGDPAFVDVPVEAMLAEARMVAARPAVRSADQPGHTTSVVVVDGAGNAVAMNHSLASHGGSGVVTDGLGFLYNNCMAGFDVEPGRPNSIAPGKARWSAACPAIAVAADGRHRLAITGPGATRAIAAVAQGVLGVLDHGRTAQEAAASTRIDAHDGVIDLEDGAPGHVADWVARLGRRGVTVQPNAAAALYLVARAADGRLDAAADPRRPGGAIARQN